MFDTELNFKESFSIRNYINFLLQYGFLFCFFLYCCSLYFPYYCNLLIAMLYVIVICYESLSK